MDEGRFDRAREPRDREPLRMERDPRDRYRDREPRGDPRDPRARDPRASRRGGPVGDERHGEPSHFPPGIPAELASSDPDKAQLIMQVLQLTDEQIRMLPAEQQVSILELKKQIASGPK